MVVRFAAISSALLALLVASPQAGIMAFVPAAPPVLTAQHGLWGSSAPAAAATAASTPVPYGFFGPAAAATVHSGRRRGIARMMTPPAAGASAGQATKVRRYGCNVNVVDVP